MNANYTFKDGITVNADCLQRAEEKHNKIEKCKYCKGTGLVQVAQNARGLKECPYCKGQAGIITR